MLKLKVNGYNLNLAEDIAINLTIENPLITTDRIPIPGSLSFELEPTPTNLKATNYPNRVTVAPIDLSSEFELSFGPVIFLKGTFMVLGFDKKIKCQVVGVTLSDYAKKSLKDVTLQRYDFGRGTENYPNFTTSGSYGYAFAQKIQQSIPGTDLFVAPPVRIAGVEYDRTNGGNGRPDRGGSTTAGENGLVMADQMYLNYFNPRAKTYWPQSFWHPWIYPMPKVSYVVDYIFDKVLEVNPFLTGELSKLVLVTSFHRNWPRRILLDNDFPRLPMVPGTGGRPTRVPVSSIPDQYKADTFFRLESFLPDMPSSEFLQSILKMFCATLYPVSGKLRLMYNKDIFASTAVDSWSDKLTGRLSTELMDLQTYMYGYSGVDSDDEVIGEFSVNSVQDLINLDVTEINGALINVATTGQVFRKTVKEGTAFYDLENSGLGGQKEGDNTFDMVSQMSPLKMSLNKYWWIDTSTTTLPKLDWYVPEMGVNRESRPVTTSVMFYHGLKSTFTAGDEYPFLTSHNYDHFGNRLGDISLSFNGPDGLIAKYHTVFKAWVEKKKIKASGTFLLSALDLKELDLSKRKNIQGKNFFIDKINITIRKHIIDPAQIDFIEA